MICIDESGDTGKNGGRYFVIAAIEMSNPKRLKNIVRKFCIKRGLTEIKGTFLRVPERQELINKLNRIDDYSITYLVLDKENFKRKDMLGQNILFNYLSSFVFQDIFKKTDKQEICLCFDNRTVKTSSKFSLPDYLMTKTIEWNIEKDIKFNFCEPKSHRGIQVADLVANTIFQHYRYNQDHFYKQLKIRKSIKFPYQQFGH